MTSFAFAIIDRKEELVEEKLGGILSAVNGELFPGHFLFSQRLPDLTVGIKRIGSGSVFFTPGPMDLLPKHPDFPRRGNAQPDLVTAHANHGHYNIIADGETLAGPATQYQHRILLSEKVEEGKFASVSMGWESATARAGTAFF